MDVCRKHGIVGRCPRCPSGDQPVVWVSDGGRAYHFDRHCEALRSGQNKVIERGGQVGEVTRMSLAGAVRSGWRPCRTCRR